MNAVRRFLDLFRDSPTYGRDRATLISGFTIGTAGLLLNFAVLLLVLPLMLDPNDRAWRTLTENMEFGQLLALILLGGATGFATVLIPLRLATVFWGPRTWRYFDQIVLSGISPFRFVIGKATSQNLFLGLILFLLLPYLVLSLTLGGVRLDFFVAGLFLVWLYCMQLAVVTLWASLHMNDLLAAFVVIAAATILTVLGCLPMRFQPFVITPFPALIQPVLSAFPDGYGASSPHFFSVFIKCAVGMTAVIGVALLGIFLGPLFGIIRENSTFGEVVRKGDSKRKLWLRLRLHIQRPSEIAFFYENRSRAFHRNEGLIRWGIGFGGLLLLSGAAYAGMTYFMSTYLTSGIGGQLRWLAYEFHVMNLIILGCSLVLGVILFSHSKNSTYLRLPFARGLAFEVSRMDTVAFLLVLLISTAASIVTPLYFDKYFAAPTGNTLFPKMMSVSNGQPADYFRIVLEGSAVISISGLTVYALHRLVCMTTWIKSVTFMLVGFLYFIVVCILPLVFAAMFLEVPELRSIPHLANLVPRLGMASPFMMFTFLFNELGPRFPPNVSTIPFYLVHGVLLSLALLAIVRRRPKLRAMYLAEPVRESN